MANIVTQLIFPPKDAVKSQTFAGLWSTYLQEGETICSCTIITTEANEIMRPIHQRMPVILQPDNYDLWLDSTLKQPELLQSLLKPFEKNRLKVYPVSTLVNNPRNNSPECISFIES